MHVVNDTICAISTPPGNGAIAVIRLSGPEAVAVCGALFSSQAGPMELMPSHTLRHGWLRDANEDIDEVVVSLFRAPRSYTGEDVVEISCHGSEYVQQRILQALLRQGARAASPGEFTQRAFLNGKMDLSQAEAVADIIASQSEAGHRIALTQMRGGFSDRLQTLRSRLLELVSLMELELDFSEEDVEFADRNRLSGLVAEMEEVISRLIRSFAYGNVVKTGVPVAIVGKTNVGKSTLLNALLNEEKALVSDIHGTTRDSIEDVITISGIRFRFIDTAGIRHTDDVVESLGIERTMQKMRHARLVLLVVDAALSVTEIEKQVQSLKLTPEQGLMILLNKADRCDIHHVDAHKTALRSVFSSVSVSPDVLAISAKFGQGIQELEAALVARVQALNREGDDVVVTNIRHLEALQQALSALLRVRDGLHTTLPVDLLTQDAREVLHHLGTITGQISSQEILENIFTKFCIGK